MLGCRAILVFGLLQTTGANMSDEQAKDLRRLLEAQSAKARNLDAHDGADVQAMLDEINKCMKVCPWLTKNFQLLVAIQGSGVMEKIAAGEEIPAEDLTDIQGFCKTCDYPSGFDPVECGVAQCGCEEADCTALIKNEVVYMALTGVCKIPQIDIDLEVMFKQVMEDAADKKCDKWMATTTTTTAAPALPADDASGVDAVSFSSLSMLAVCVLQGLLHA